MFNQDKVQRCNETFIDKYIKCLLNSLKKKN